MLSIPIISRGMPLVAAAMFTIGSLPAPAAADEVLKLLRRDRLPGEADTFTIIDVEPHGPSPGDMDVFDNPIFDQGGSELLGHESGWCVRTIPFEQWDCISTISLGDGQIMTQGIYFDKRPDADGAVVGGTGKYTSAHGTIYQHDRGATSLDYDYTITLTK